MARRSTTKTARADDAPAAPTKTATKRTTKRKSSAPSSSFPSDDVGRARAIVDAVRPSVGGGAFPAKAIAGEPLRVEADIFTDGHDRPGAVLRWRKAGERAWREARLTETHNDLWFASFTPTAPGAWEFSVQAWSDPFLTWSHDLRRRLDAGQDVSVDMRIGASIVDEHASSGRGDAEALANWRRRMLDESTPADERGRIALSDDLERLMWDASPRRFAAELPVHAVWADRPLAGFGAWYEMFPRSAAETPGEHGTLRDVVRVLPYVAGMGFDVLYLPPIHPIGRAFRKGRNNAPSAEEDDVGSPWAIGAEEGGHAAIHPELGTLDDFDDLVKACRSHNLELALDIAFQCAPDHPYVREHPEWFRHRPDGSIQYAENPPKKYQDIYPFDFECDDWRTLWEELKRVVLFWVDRGVTVFRVDNPHTKPFRFWDWLIGEVRKDHPEVIFLAEAFTRPKRMARLAKGGFTQSYTYFAWRNTPHELREYVEELASRPMRDFFRPNFWPNTPDILTPALQEGGRPAAMSRLVLAATLSPLYGIYGPVYELCDFAARPGVEENLNSEKYELRSWERNDRWSLAPYIALVNSIRRENPAFRRLDNVAFHHCDNPAHLAYSKRSPDGANTVLVVVNTDHKSTQWGTLRLDLQRLGLREGAAFDVEDLLGGDSFRWRGADNEVGLEAGMSHIFRVTPLDGAALEQETE